MSRLDDATLAAMLREDGDDRVRSDAAGCNAYGYPALPRADMLPFSACTASGPDRLWWEAAREEAGWLRAATDDEVFARWEQTREEVSAIAGGVEVVFCPSGTDVEYLAALLAMGDRPLRHVVTGLEEAGSGTALALEGRHFAANLPFGGVVPRGSRVEGLDARPIEVVRVPVRGRDGHPRLLDEVSAACVKAVREGCAGGSDVLLHGMAASKTGLLGPHVDVEDALADLARRGCLTVAVDAAQGRVSRRFLESALDMGCLVQVTTSKFFGAPPFAGALLVPPGTSATRGRSLELPSGLRGWFAAPLFPPSWTRARASASPAPARGLLLRWRVGLELVRSWRSLGRSRRRALIEAFAEGAGALGTVPGVRLVSPAPQTGTVGFGIAGFTVLGRDGEPVGPVAARDLHRAMVAEGVALGQPVLLPGGEVVLRAALGVPLAMRMHHVSGPGDPAGAGWLADRLRAVGTRLVELAG